MKGLLIIFALLLAIDAQAQTGLTQSAEGKSALLFRGSDLNVDLSEAEFSAGFNNLRRSLGKNKMFVFGASAQAKSEEGIGDLFSAGDFVPSANIDAFAGVSFSNAVLPNRDKEIIHRGQLLKKRDSLQSGFERSFPASVRVIINEETGKIKNDSIRDVLEDDLLKAFDNDVAATDIWSYIEDYPSQEEAVPEVKNAVKKIKSRVKMLTEPYSNAIGEIDIQWQAIEQKISDKSFWHLVVFGFGGINAMEFTHFTELDTFNLANSFNSTYFRGGNLGLGANLQYRSVLVGLNYSYHATNNFELLNKKEYTLTEQVSGGALSLTGEKVITAYSGEYAEIEVSNISFDVAINVKMDSASTFYMIVNPYARATIASRNKELMPGKVNIGTGLYFYKATGKIMFGVYAELPDVQNNYEKMKPIDEQRLRPPMQRMTFGITGKFSLNSILNSY